MAIDPTQEAHFRHQALMMAQSRSTPNTPIHEMIDTAEQIVKYLLKGTVPPRNSAAPAEGFTPTPGSDRGH